MADRNFRNAEGIVSNAFLSGGDYSGDHNGMPDGQLHGCAQTSRLTTKPSKIVLIYPPLKADSLRRLGDERVTDPNYLHLLARDELT